jgi:hypothetical protein
MNDHPGCMMPDGAAPCPQYTALLAERDRLRADIKEDSRILRSSVPERWKQTESAVGAAQSYIVELEVEKAALITALRNIAQWSEYAKAVIAFVKD